jgi:hypothetical protein
MKALPKSSQLDLREIYREIEKIERQRKKREEREFTIILLLDLCDFMNHALGHDHQSPKCTWSVLQTSNFISCPTTTRYR